MSDRSKALLSPDELESLLQQENSVRMVDATFVMPGAPVDAHALFTEKRIGNAVFFDIDEIADPQADMAHMLPSAEAFASAVSALGISNSDTVVVYDQGGIAMAACRAWWMFRVFGHDKVYVLDGGLPYWEATGHDMNTNPPIPPVPGTFTSAFRAELVRDLEDMKATLDDPDTLILDARSPDRFAGMVTEPRPGLRSGHIPGSSNVPFMNLMNPTTGGLMPPGFIEEYLAGFPLQKNIVTSCGSGVTACVLALALYTIGKENVAVYDGSWTEWGLESSGTEIATQL
ncbi:MAG: sulfurtransferase [Rhodospirillales bacterium]|nr:sulfurtransferase [Rhodospirillales bacterium]MCB9995761.1 sulfurtransferase [Rhodospirillales bacterium]